LYKVKSEIEREREDNNMYIKSLIILVVLLATSCVQYERLHHLPKDIHFMANKVANRTYVENKYDCSNMSSDLALELAASGYDARIIVFKINPTVYHAIVEVVVDGHYWYLDPTRGLNNFSRSKPKDPLFIFTPLQIFEVANNPGFRQQIIFEFLNHHYEEEEADDVQEQE